MKMFIKRYVSIRPSLVCLDGQAVDVNVEEGGFLKSLYRTLKLDYPKFFKMDNLSKLGFLASEMLLSAEENRFAGREDLAVICFNRSASLDTDSLYQNTIQAGEEYFPSPSVFVYTLPNIVTAEVAIRNKIYGETSFYICEEFDAGQICRTVSNTFAATPLSSALVGWIEYEGDKCEALMMQIETAGCGCPLSVESLMKIYKPLK
jgi:3-oxoacyl-[acyl-carrier-protein] synthase-1